MDICDTGSRASSRLPYRWTRRCVTCCHGCITQNLQPLPLDGHR